MAVSFDLKKHDQINNEETSQIALVIVPYLEQGHLNPLLNLSRLLSSYKIPVFFLGTSTSNRQAKFRLSGWDILDFPTIQFHDLVPVSSSSSSSSSVTTSVMEKIGSFFTSILLLREPIRDFLQEISTRYRRIVVINDSGMSWVVQDAVSMSNTECYCFHTISVFTDLSFAYETRKKPPLPSPVAEIIAELPPRENTFDSETIEYIKMQRESRDFYSVGLHNSCKEIEGVFIELLEQQKEKKQWAIGPLNPVEISMTKISKQTHECFSWLDKQDPNSVIYVSFGSTTTLSKEQINELALGLQQSGQKFIWVLREADKKGGDRVERGSKFDLPEGFEERIKEKGIGFIEKNWAPQLEILSHSSIGGFMSHCGWNSCIESISMGVPIAAWPIHSDQPRNTVLITNVLKIGIVVRDWGNRDELVSAVKIKNAVRCLMCSDEGVELRRRATEMSGAVKKSVMNGSSRKEMDSFVAHITR